MGCDIHMFAEKRTKKDDKWEKVGAVFESTYSSDKGEPTSEPYTGRNYELFAFLADVRNRFDIVPICEPKGWPNDASEDIKKDLIDYWENDGHSASWFTLKELKEADWKQKVQMGGVVPADVYEYLKSHKEIPKSYSQGISGPNVQTVSEEEWNKLPWAEKISGIRWHVYMRWYETLNELCEWFIKNTIPALEKLGEPENVRIVFNFDN